MNKTTGCNGAVIANVGRIHDVSKEVAVKVEVAVALCGVTESKLEVGEGS